MKTLTALLFTLLTLTACSLQPVHGRAVREAMAVDLSAVSIETESTRYAQLLKAEIQDQVNPGVGRSPAQYRLKITFNANDIPLFINPDGTSSRGDLNYQTSYILTRLRDGVAIGRGTLNRIGSYNTSQNADFASYVSQEDARKRIILELAQDYKLRLISLLPTLNNPNAGEVKALPDAPISLVPNNSDIYENRRPGF